MARCMRGVHHSAFHGAPGRAGRARACRRTSHGRSSTGRRRRRRSGAAAGASRASSPIDPASRAIARRARVGPPAHVGPPGICGRPRDLVDERPLDVVLAQLTRAARPLAARRPLDEQADDRPCSGARTVRRRRERQDAAGLFAFGFDEVLVAIDAGHRGDRIVRPRGQQRRRATRRARRRSRRPRWRDRGRAGSSGTPARRTSTPRASGWTSARRAPRPLVRRSAAPHAVVECAAQFEGVAIRRVVVHRRRIGQPRQRPADDVRLGRDGGCRWTGSPAAPSATRRTASTPRAPARAAACRRWPRRSAVRRRMAESNSLIEGRGGGRVPAADRRASDTEGRPARQQTRETGAAATPSRDIRAIGRIAGSGASSRRDTEARC